MISLPARVFVYVCVVCVCVCVVSMMSPAGHPHLLRHPHFKTFSGKEKFTTDYQYGLHSIVLIAT